MYSGFDKLKFSLNYELIAAVKNIGTVFLK